MDISQHIRHLLYYNNCVIIPGFGGLIANFNATTVFANQNRFLPPSKIIAFNKKLTNNDGLLINRIVTSENIGFDDATQKVNQFVSNLDKRLKEKSVVNLPGIGKFYHDIEQNLQFIPEKKVNYLLSSFGMTEVHASLIIRKEPIIKDEKLTDKRKSKPKIDHKNVVLHNTNTAHNKVFNRLASKILQGANLYSVLIVLLSGLLVFQWMWYDMKYQEVKLHFSNIASPLIQKLSELTLSPKSSKSDQELQDLNTGSIPPKPKEDKSEETLSVNTPDKKSTEKSQEDIIPISKSENIGEVEIESNTIQKSNLVNQEIVSYYIIIGSFKLIKNAERLIERIKSEDA